VLNWHVSQDTPNKRLDTTENLRKNLKKTALREIVQLLLISKGKRVEKAL